jgi:dTDP-4-amino-4,6-dideoxygalactose transaminase
MPPGPYRRWLESAEAVTLPFEPAWSNAVYHLFVVRTAEREDLMSRLREAGMRSIGAASPTTFTTARLPPVVRYGHD